MKRNTRKSEKAPKARPTASNKVLAPTLAPKLAGNHNEVTLVAPKAKAPKARPKTNGKILALTLAPKIAGNHNEVVLAN